MSDDADDAPAQRLAIYETLVAQTRPLWIGVSNERGAVIEHLRYRNGLTGYRTLSGAQASQSYDDLESAVAWLVEHDRRLHAGKVLEQAQACEAHETLTACGTGSYYVLADQDVTVESFLIPMALSPDRIRINCETLLWHNGIAMYPGDDENERPPQGAEFTPGNLPYVLGDFQRIPMKGSWQTTLESAYIVNAKLILLQRYAMHDAQGLTQCLYEHAPI